jgi:hypothetical protein
MNDSSLRLGFRADAKPQAAHFQHPYRRLPMSDATLSLRGKTVAVHMRSRAGGPPIVLKDCMLETRGSRLFLVGTSVPVQPGVTEWTDGVRRAIAWDAVDDYLLFDSPDDYYARCQAAQPVEVSATVPMFDAPTGWEGTPVEPSGIAVEPETPLEVGSVVLSFTQGRWWRTEVVALEENEMVRIHFPGWDAKWDTSVPRGELQVYLGESLQSDDHFV